MAAVIAPFPLQLDCDGGADTTVRAVGVAAADAADVVDVARVVRAAVVAGGVVG